MTIIDYFNQFWQEDENKHFTLAETRLYLYLLYLWNSTGRNEWFECKTSMIERYAEINPKTLTRCRDSLKKRKMLNFKQGSTKGKYPYYSLLNVKDNVKDNVNIHRVIRVKEKETSSNEDVKKAVDIDYESLLGYFNENLSQWLPKIKDIKESRRKLVDARVKEFGKEKIIEVLNAVA